MNQEEKPHAPSCDNNQAPIFETIKHFLKDKKNLIEIGSGTGQHAVFMAPKLSHMTWTLTDLEERHRGMSLWLREKPILNIKGPLMYKAGVSDFPKGAHTFDVAFTSNTLHIMTWQECLKLFDDLEKNLEREGLFLIYGAFKYNGNFSSDSNKQFEIWLKEKNKDYSQKNFEDILSELEKRSFTFNKDISMPSNNQLMVFQKK